MKKESLKSSDQNFNGTVYSFVVATRGKQNRVFFNLHGHYESVGKKTSSALFSPSSIRFERFDQTYVYYGGRLNKVDFMEPNQMVRFGPSSQISRYFCC